MIRHWLYLFRSPLRSVLFTIESHGLLIDSKNKGDPAELIYFIQLDIFGTRKPHSGDRTTELLSTNKTKLIGAVFI